MRLIGPLPKFPRAEDASRSGTARFKLANVLLAA